MDEFERCRTKIPYINKLLKPIFGGDPFVVSPNKYGFSGVHSQYITQVYEGGLHTGNMMQGLLSKAQALGVRVLHNCKVNDYVSQQHGVRVATEDFDFRTGTLLIATNGFAGKWTEKAVRPARAQVLITRPIPKLSVKGVFHLNEGFDYFREINGRILIGGGRHLDIDGEHTESFGQTVRIQEYLEDLLRNIVLPNIHFDVARRWSGIMGVGEQKKPLLKALEANVFCGVRLGGMGVAIGTQVGRKLADFCR